MTQLKAVAACAVLLIGCRRHPEDEYAGGVPVRLSVKTNPPTLVTVLPRAGGTRSRLELGRTPIDAQPGAFVGDMIRLSNPERGILYEEQIEYGQPNELKLISKVFRADKRPRPLPAEDGGMPDASP